MSAAQSATQSPEEIADLICGYVCENPSAVVVEDGKMLFDFSTAHYSAAPERDRCLLQIWSEEGNIVRRATSAEVKNGILKLSVLRFGQSKASRMEICAHAERQSPSALKAMRVAYQRGLEHALVQLFPGWTLERITTSADLEHSFGAVCTRGLLRRGQERIAVVGCGQGESQSTIDNSVAVAVLWLDYCREHYSAKSHVSSLALFVPQGRALTAQLRLSHLDHQASQWQLFAYDEHTAQCEPLDLASELNLSSHLVHCVNRGQTLERFAKSVARIRALCPPVESVAISSSAVSFRICGLEFARASMEPDRHFRVAEHIVFGAAPAEYEWNDNTEPLLRQLIERILLKRRGQAPAIGAAVSAAYPPASATGAAVSAAYPPASATGAAVPAAYPSAPRDHTHPFYRLQPERWLQSVVERDISLIDSRLDPTLFYPQVPAFAASDRAIIDLLGITRDGRLAVIELKAAEDFHLPVQGLDYWARVRQHHRRGDFQRAGYFPGRILSERDPILILAAPALHLHPSTATMLRYFSPELDWRLAALDERWRDGIRVVFQKKKE